MRCGNAIFIFLALTFTVTAVAAVEETRVPEPELIVLRETGPRDKRVNIVIIGDGYTFEEKGKFRSHMETVAKAVIGDLPLLEYGEYFNIYGIFTASRESGADFPSRGEYRDTYYGASYDPGLERLLTIEYTKGFETINSLVPESDMQFAVVNSEVYGGSGGDIAVANHTSPEIIAHEAQHSFAGLGDEYDYDGGRSGWESPNTTRIADREAVRWAHWILPTTPLPTPGQISSADLVGVFEGAAYNSRGWFRPKLDCRMRENAKAFCEVCSEAILLSMYDRVSPLDSAFPPSGGAVQSYPGRAASLRVKVKSATGRQLEIAWFVDGSLRPEIKGTEFRDLLDPGIHEVVARISDATPLVRNDPLGLTADSAVWTMEVLAPSAKSGIGRGGGILMRAERDAFWIDLPAAGEFRLSLRSLDGSGAEALISRRGAPGANRLARATLGAVGPGVYAAQVEYAGVRSGRLILIP